jgi:DNA excision repair protein ERCC-2
VRDLVEFVWRAGDLGEDGEFAGSFRALAGTRGHQRVQRSRPEGYETEVSLSHQIETPHFVLHIRGRADGLVRTPTALLVEEIKTILGSEKAAADPLHWAQGKIYAAVLVQQQPLPQVIVQLTYLNLDSGAQTELRQSFAPNELRDFLESTAAQYLAWVRAYYQWCQLRDRSIAALKFPFPAYRPGQRVLAVAAYRALARPGRLFVEAPTGIGKTISILFPAIKAMGRGHLAKIFYLTAKTMGRTVVEKALADLRQAGLRLRALTLTARERICFHNQGPCQAPECPFAKGYYDRIKGALQAVLTQEALNRATIEAAAQRHQVCPFALGLDASRWVDALICDYNYVFDPRVYLRRFFDDESNDYALLVDEAHNLVDRARAMFSAELNQPEILAAKRLIQETRPACAKAAGKINAALRAMSREVVDPAQDGDQSDLFGAPVLGGLDLESQTDLPIGHRKVALQTGALAIREFPQQILLPLRAFIKTAEVWLIQGIPAPLREHLLDLYFTVLGFLRTAELYDQRYVTILEGKPGQMRLRLFCRDPSFLLQKALNRGRSAIFFSATLTPLDYFRQLLGGTPTDPVLQLPTPFPPANLAVLVADRIRTSFKDRADTCDQVASAIAALVTARRGNYLVYFPSYQYLAQVLERFRARCPDLATLVQTPSMTEPERDTFLAAFDQENQMTMVGFAVMGGVFGEAIDLVGERLVGVVIVGVGLPQLCLERDLIRAYFQETKQAGFDYAYRFPGMNRVLQAAGRVIRAETDRGTVLLIDSRFSQAPYRRLLPAWWQPVRVAADQQIAALAQQFWEVPLPSSYIMTTRSGI